MNPMAPAPLPAQTSEMPRPRRFHMHITPFLVQIEDHTATFVGVTFHSRSFMIEYNVEPPIDRASIFGPVLLMLLVRDDVDNAPHQTQWEDFPWPNTEHPGRMTTRIERRPPAQARRLWVAVHTPVIRHEGPRIYTSASPEAIATFDILLPAAHGEPWPDNPRRIRTGTG